MQTDLDLDGTVTEAELASGSTDVVSRVVEEHVRIGVVRDGLVVAVLMDAEDARILERLEIAAEEEWAADREPDDGVRYDVDGNLIEPQP